MILFATGFISHYFYNFTSHLLKTNILEKPSLNRTYIAVLKWGNTLEKNIPSRYQEKWQGSIESENAVIKINQNLHLVKLNKKTVTNAIQRFNIV